MKKIQILFLLFITIFLLSCGVQNTTLDSTVTTSSNSTTNKEITTTVTEFVNPFGELNFIRHLDVSDSVISMIEKSSGRIAYLDNEMYVYYDESFNASSFYVFMDGKTVEYDTHSTMDYSDNFLINYDVENDVIYYYNSSRVNSVPSVVDKGINLYNYRMRDINYYNSEYLLIGNSFLTFKGETLFSDVGTIIFPYKNIGEDLLFYSYQSDSTQDEACSIQTYNGFNDNFENTVVHDEFTCGADYDIQNRNVVIKLMDFTRLGGYVTITSDGEIHVMDFALDISDFKSYVYESFRVVNEWMIYFQYKDTAGESHFVVTSYDLSNIFIDEMSMSMAKNNSYLDQNYRFYKYSSTEYRLYKDEECFYTYTPLSSSFSLVRFSRSGDYGVIYEANRVTGDGKITRINLIDGTEVSYEKSMFLALFKSGNYLMIQGENEWYLYDILNDDFISIGVNGTFKTINDDFFLIYSDDYVYLYDLVHQDMIEMNRIGHLQRYNPAYAFLVEYEGENYLIG